MNETNRDGSRRRGGGRLRLAAGFIWAVLVAAGLLAAGAAGLMPEAPDNWTYDWRTALLSERAAKPREDIALVLIGEESLAQYPSLSPIDHGLMAAIVRALDAAGAKAIGLDFVFERETDPEKTAGLLAAIRGARAQIVLGALDARTPLVSETQRAYQDEFLAKAGRPVGHVIVGQDPSRFGIGDQVARYIAGPAREGPARPGFDELLASHDGQKSVPSSPYIAWLRPPAKGGSGVFPTFEVPPHAPGSPDDAILPPSWRPSLGGRIVLVGGDFMDRDQHLTPFSVVDADKMAGVEIHAQIVAQLRDRRAIRDLPGWAEFLALFALAAGGFWLATRWRVRSRDFLVSLAGIVALVLLGGLLFGLFSLIIPSASLFFAWLAGVWGGHLHVPMLKRLGFKDF